MNPNEFSVEIYVERNDRGFDKHSSRTVVVQAGEVDINEIVEDMIDSIKGIEKF